MKKIIIVVLTLVLVFLGTTAYAQEYTVEDANLEYQELRTNLQQYLNKNGIPLFYAKTENIFAVLAKQIIVSDTNGSYVGYIYQVVDVAMIKAVDFPFEMKGPAKYPIVIWKPILI